MKYNTILELFIIYYLRHYKICEKKIVLLCKHTFGFNNDMFKCCLIF